MLEFSECRNLFNGLEVLDHFDFWMQCPRAIRTEPKCLIEVGSGRAFSMHAYVDLQLYQNESSPVLRLLEAAIAQALLQYPSK